MGTHLAGEEEAGLPFQVVEEEVVARHQVEEEVEADLSSQEAVVEEVALTCQVEVVEEVALICQVLEEVEADQTSQVVEEVEADLTFQVEVVEEEEQGHWEEAEGVVVQEH